MPTRPTLTKVDPTPLYAIAGAGEFAVEKLRELPAKIQPEIVRGRAAELAGNTNAIYDDFAARGRKLVAQLRRQPATQAVVARTKTATARAKGATATAEKTVKAEPTSETSTVS